MVKESIDNATSTSAIISLISVMLISILAALLIWNIIFNPGILVPSGERGGNADSGGGGGGMVGITLLRQNGTNKTLNFTQTLNLTNNTENKPKT